MIQKKYKLGDVAKDINVAANEIIELLQKWDQTPKKAATALSDEELNYIFEFYTQKNEVKSFDSYFALLDQKPEKKAKAVSKPAEKKLSLIHI